jgi:hypothetical protein
MAHYALLDENNIVVQVITGVEENELIEGKTPEEWYGEFHNMRCLRTSYNTYANTHKSGGVPFRKNYASKGFIYSPEFDAFIPPKPYDSWLLDRNTFQWIPPTPKPEDGENYIWKWDNFNKEWVKVFFEIIKK